MAIDPTALDRIVTILRGTVTDDGFGSSIGWDAPDELGTVWAFKRDVSDAERFRAGQVQAQITTRFQMHYSALTASITSRDRLECEGTVYEIVGVPKELGRREGIEVTGAAIA